MSERNAETGGSNVSDDARFEYVTVEIKKNQFDAVATLVYSNGASIVHWAMAFGIIFVKWPNVEIARREEKEYIDLHGREKFEINNPFQISCEQLATDMENLLEVAIATHLICGILNVYREIFETKLGSIGQLMRFLEIVCMGFSLAVLIMSF